MLAVDVDADSWTSRDRSTIADVERLRFFPLAVTEASGAWVTNEDGRRLLDLSAGWSAAGVGYAHPRVVAAVESAVRRMPGVSVLSATNPEVVQLAEELLAVVPGSGDRRVYVGHSGSDANAAAISAARRSTGRPGVMTFAHSYHGGLGVGQDVSGLHVEGGGTPDPGLVTVAYPDAYRPHRPGLSAAEMVDDIAGQVATQLDSGNIAVVVVEAVQCDGGVVVPPPGFLARLRSLCDRSGTLLLCDEVKVGLGRTGAMFAFQADRVLPDMVTLGKSLGGGLPLSAAIGPTAVMDSGRARSLLTTAGNPVCAAAGRAVLDVIAAEDLVARARLVGDHLMAGLLGLQARHSSIGDVRGRGLVLGLDLVADRDSREPSGSTAAKVAYRAFELGAVMYCVGPGGNVIELTPPLTLTAAEADQAIAIIDEALSDVDAGRVPDEAIASYQGW